MNATIDWDKIAASYPVNKRYIWLNNSGTVAPGNHLIKEMELFMELYSQHNILEPALHLGNLHSTIKSQVASILGCSPEDVALIHNTAEGINFISHGLNLNKGDEVLLMDQEYPSNVYPWEHLKEKGITLSFIPGALTAEGFYENVKNTITPRTRAVALSAVHWCTGMPVPLKEINEVCLENQIHLVVDVSQGAGHIPLAMDEWGISFCAGSAWKWLQGPLGLGILMIKKEKIPELMHVFKGTSSVVSSDAYFPYKDTLKMTVDRYVYSTPSLMDWFYFKASLQFLQQIGFAAIRSRIFALSDYLITNLTSLGFSVLNQGFAPVKSGIVVAEHAQLSSSEIVKKLRARDIICADRVRRVRFSVHITNTFEQLDRLIAVLKDIV